MKGLRVYVAGNPSEADVVRLVETGCAPLVPVDGSVSQTWIPVADILLWLGPGADDAEDPRQALSCGIPVYTDVDELIGDMTRET